MDFTVEAEIFDKIFNSSDNEQITWDNNFITKPYFILGY